MKIHGLPENFWVVALPSATSILADVCFECSFDKFAKQVLGGLRTETIYGIFADENEAIDIAQRLIRVAEVPAPGTYKVHQSPWPNWIATQESGSGVFICNKETDEKLLIEPPKEWGRNWAWNFAEDGSGIVMRQTT